VRCGRKAGHLVTVQRLEKRLEAARYGAAHRKPVHLDLAHPRRPLYALDGRPTDEADFNPLDQDLVTHAPEARGEATCVIGGIAD
jgi:hypothetical protein